MHYIEPLPDWAHTPASRARLEARMRAAKRAEVLELAALGLIALAAFIGAGIADHHALLLGILN